MPLDCFFNDGISRTKQYENEGDKCNQVGISGFYNCRQTDEKNNKDEKTGEANSDIHEHFIHTISLDEIWLNAFQKCHNPAPHPTGPDGLSGWDDRPEMLSVILQINCSMIPDDPLALLKEHVRSDALIEHCMATGAIMKATAPLLSEDPVLFEAVGILHDIDFEEVDGDMETHGIVGAKMLRSAGVSEAIAGAVERHNHHLFSGYSEPLDIALQAADSISGLIIACALVKGGDISEVTTKTVRKKMKDKGFAAGCDRERIRAIEPLMDLDSFINAAIQGVSTIWEGR